MEKLEFNETVSQKPIIEPFNLNCNGEISGDFISGESPFAITVCKYPL